MPSLFLGVYRALYDFAPSSDGEVELAEGDILYVLEKSDVDAWWKVKKQSTEGPEADEPVGLVPSAYIEPAQPESSSRALYDYERQTEEELSFNEGDVLNVYHSTDPDWILVGQEEEYGFAPANYLEPIQEGGSSVKIHAPPKPPRVTFASPEPEEALEETGYEDQDGLGDNDSFYNEDTASPTLPSRPQAAVPTPIATRPARSQSFEENAYAHPRYPYSPSPPPATSSTVIPAGFQQFEVQEVDSKRRKHKATLGIGNGTLILLPEEGRKEHAQWSIGDVVNHSTERKHVFLDLQNPSASLDLHAGSTEAADSIGNILNDLMGSYRAKGLREVLQAASQGSKSGDKIGAVLYDFDAAGDDEVSVKVGEEVVIVDDTKSDEWWMVRRGDGKEGVVPSSYVEFKRMASKPIPPPTELDPHNPRQRRDSLSSVTTGKQVEASKPKPDAGKVRTWTDRSASFKVDAALIGCRDGKIHLHKTNGVKIAVPANKMSTEDVAYVERLTGRRVDGDQQQEELKKKLAQRKDSLPPPEAPPKDTIPSRGTVSTTTAVNGAKRTEYDWFEFFLACGVDVNNCQRYAASFQRDQMDESVLEEIYPDVLRTLGLKEGDILRVTRTLDAKFNRKRSKSAGAIAEADDDRSGLISGPDGMLKTNRRARPTPQDRIPDVVDPKGLERAVSPQKPAVADKKFDDDAWTNRPSSADRANNEPVKPQQPQMTASLLDLSSIKPLQPQPTIQRSQSSGPQPNSIPPHSPLSPKATRPETNFSIPQPQQPYSSMQDLAITQQTGSSMRPPPSTRPLSAPRSLQYSAQPQFMQPQYSGYNPQPAYNASSSTAPPGQSLNDMSVRLQQQRLQPQYTSADGHMSLQMPTQPIGFGFQPQQTGYGMMPQTAGFNPNFYPQQMAHTNGYNAISQNRAASMNSLPPALVPQRTAQQPPQALPLTAHHTGPVANYGLQMHSQPPGQFQQASSLQPQATGPPPSVKFGVTAKKMETTPTGRRANLAAASM